MNALDQQVHQSHLFGGEQLLPDLPDAAHGQHGGRHRDVAHPSQPGRRDEAGQIGGGSTAQADNYKAARGFKSAGPAASDKPTQWLGSAGGGGMAGKNSESANGSKNTVGLEALLSGGGTGQRLTEQAVQASTASQNAQNNPAPEPQAQENLRFWLQGDQQRGEVVVQRDGKPVELKVTLGRRELAEGTGSVDNTSEKSASDLMGMTVAPLTPEIAAELGVSRDMAGLVVQSVDPKGAAADKGLTAGDVITEAGQQPVTSLADLQARIKEARDAGRKSILLMVRRAGEPRFVALPVAS